MALAIGGAFLPLNRWSRRACASCADVPTIDLSSGSSASARVICSATVVSGDCIPASFDGEQTLLFSFLNEGLLLNVDCPLVCLISLQHFLVPFGITFDTAEEMLVWESNLPFLCCSCLSAHSFTHLYGSDGAIAVRISGRYPTPADSDALAPFIQL